jgi:iron complex transport system ATP-binding protein
MTGASPDARPVDAPPVVELAGVDVRRAGRTILGPIDWTVRRGERWVILGPNGSGKTTLVQVASTWLWPSSGSVRVLGAEIGAVDARELRRRIGYASSSLERQIDDGLTALDVVRTARHAALGPWWHRYSAADRDRALGLLDRLGVVAFAERPFGLLSTGERRRVQIARALMPEPEVLILDEPSASLDLGAREALIRDLDALAADRALAAIALVNHHVEEIPRSFDHALVLAEGRAVSNGPIDRALTGAALSAAFRLPIEVERRDGRYRAWLDGGER